MAICRFCNRQFRNKQAVRSHLRWCQAYKNRDIETTTNPGANFPQGTNKEFIEGLEALQEDLEETNNRISKVEQKIEAHEQQRIQEEQKVQITRIQQEQAKYDDEEIQIYIRNTIQEKKPLPPDPINYIGIYGEAVCEDSEGAYMWENHYGYGWIKARFWKPLK